MDGFPRGNEISERDPDPTARPPWDERIVQGDREPESGPLPRFAAQPDRPAHQFHDFFRNG